MNLVYSFGSKMKKSIDSQEKVNTQKPDYEEFLESIVDTIREALLILDKASVLYLRILHSMNDLK